MTKAPKMTHTDTLQDATFDSAMDHASGAKIEEVASEDNDFMSLMRQLTLF